MAYPKHPTPYFVLKDQRYAGVEETTFYLPAEALSRYNSWITSCPEVPRTPGLPTPDVPERMMPPELKCDFQLLMMHLCASVWRLGPDVTEDQHLDCFQGFIHCMRALALLSDHDGAVRFWQESWGIWLLAPQEYQFNMADVHGAPRSILAMWQDWLRRNPGFGRGMRQAMYPDTGRLIYTTQYWPQVLQW